MSEQDGCKHQDQRQRVCLACDNRHGCLTPEPPCLRLDRSEDERPLGGQALMARRGLLVECQTCGLFRRCWDPDAYRRRLAEQDP